MPNASPLSAEALAVIGSGVIGLSVAAEAAALGARVTVLEAADRVGGATSPASFAWTNAEGKRPPSYQHLNELGRELYHEGVSGPLPEPGFTPLPGRKLGVLGEFGQTDPQRPAPDGPDLEQRVERGGYVDLAARTAFLSERVREAGGRIETGARALGIETSSDSATVRLAAGDRRFDQVVVAAGTGTAALLEPIDPRLGALRGGDPEALRGFLIRARLDLELDELVASERICVRPDGPGRIALQSVSTERDLAAGRMPREQRSVWLRVRAIAEEILGLDIPDDAFVSYTEAERPYTADGLPAIGFVSPRVYVALTHSGVTLAPIIGRLAAQEIAGTEAAELADFRPGRF